MGGEWGVQRGREGAMEASGHGWKGMATDVLVESAQQKGEVGRECLLSHVFR